MSILLPQSTAYTFRLGPFLDSTDGNTQENALTIAYTDVLLSKAGGALTAKAETTNLTGTGANAHYTCILGTGDTGTLGALRVWCHVAGALSVYQDFLIVTALIYNSLVAGSDNLQVDTTQWLGTACATPTVNGVPEVDLTHVAGVTTNVSTLATNVDAILTDTADMQPKLGTPAGASISADILVIDNFVDGLETTIGIAGAGLMDLGGMSTTMKAQVQTECDDALVSMNLDHLVGTATAIPAIVAGTYIDQMVDDGTAVYDRTTDSLQAIRDHATTIKTDTAAILTDTGTDGVALANGAISSTKFAAGGIDAAAVAADVGYEFADALLNRNVAGGSNTGRLVKEALYLLRNRSAISSGTLTVYQTDDATSQWTAAVTTAVGNPVSGVDPA